MLKDRHWRANEISAFFKDDWKVTQESHIESRSQMGMVRRSVLAGSCRPGCERLPGFVRHRLRRADHVEFVGKNSPQPDKKMFNDDWNNFGPSVGFSFALPGSAAARFCAPATASTFPGHQLDGVIGRWSGCGRRYASGLAGIAAAMV